MSDGHWIILLTILLLLATVPGAYYARKAFRLQRAESTSRDRPELVEIQPPLTIMQDSQGVITDATFLVKNVGRGHATNVVLFIVIRNDDGTFGAEGDAAFRAAMAAPNDTIRIQAKIGSLQQRNAVNLMIVGSYFDHTGAEPVYRIPSDKWLAKWMPRELAKRKASRSRLPWKR